MPVLTTLSPAARLASSRMETPGGVKLRPEDLEIAATLIAQPNKVHPTNVIVRNRKTRQIQAADPAVIAVMTLVRCQDQRRADAGPRLAEAFPRLSVPG